MLGKMPVELLYKNSVPPWTAALVLIHIHLSFTMYVLCITAVLSLLSVSSAESLLCEEVVQPLVLEDFSKVLGKWILIEAAMDHPVLAALLTSVNSSGAEVVATHDNDTVFFHEKNMLGGKCEDMTANLTLSHNTIHFTYMKDIYNATLLRTSADYMVMFGNFSISGFSGKSFNLYGRTGKLSNFDRETYNRQMECLAVPKPTFIYDGHQELCPDKNSHLEESSEGNPQQEKSF
ncbi:hypothetical protein GJAV_G00267570 [Gymnothorax javanicus]|nr:hypothetical protein GJAV_G00267570 [Gymnothorax javanicus]